MSRVMGSWLGFMPWFGVGVAKAPMQKSVRHRVGLLFASYRIAAVMVNTIMPTISLPLAVYHMSAGVGTAP